MANAPALTPIVSVTASATPLDSYRELTALLEQNAARICEAEVQGQLHQWRSRAAASFAGGARAKLTEAELETAGQILRELAASGVNDYAVEPALVTAAKEHAGKGVAGLVAATMLVPAWQWSDSPRLRDVPTAAMPIYALHQFTPVRLSTTPGQVEAAAQRRIAAVTDLAALLEANRGSAAARGVLEAYRSQEQPDETVLPPALHLELRSAHARLLAATNRVAAQPEPFPLPREGRKLRVGVIASSIDRSRVAFQVLAVTDALNRNRFEVVVCTQAESGSAVEKRLLANGGTTMTLSGTVDEMAQNLRDASLDVALFVGNEPLMKSGVAALALHRIAAVQVWHDGTGLPSMLPQVDLYLSGQAFPPASARGERAALLPGVGAIATNDLETGDTDADWSRSSLGFDEHDVVFASVNCRLRELTYDVQRAYAELLAHVPQSRLLIACAGDESDTTSLSERFCLGFANLLATQGVDLARVRIFSDLQLRSHEDFKKCVSASNVVLAPGQFGMAEAFVTALQCQRPLVAVRSPGSPAAALLTAAGASELVGDSLPDFVAKAAKLASDGDLRAQVGERLGAAGIPLTAAHDTFVQSEAFGRILEATFDQVTVDRRAFRTARQAVTATTNPAVDAVKQEAQFFLELGSGTDAEARVRELILTAPASAELRTMLASALLLQGRNGEATDVAVTVVELEPNNWAGWHGLATAARKARRHQTAVQALETALRVDPQRTESWYLLAEIATEVGNTEMLREVANVLRQLTPDDPKVAELEATLPPI